MAKILVVDDDLATLELVKGNLEGLGHAITMAGNGAEALLAVDKEMPELIIMDVTMPVMDGFTALKAIKENEAYQDIPVIMLTGRSSGDDVARGWDEGAAFYLTKPFTADELLAITRRILDNPRMPSDKVAVE